ncbi:hypothetical protein SAMN02745121_08915 [Nannocystis exedens]|uniref:Uncharacterized protein n=2 Tax=Nannocystis exedens TaxID=54 RepID=A0A1I2ISS7_9BACT|nr:hypothetical protein NAEX_08051 [Nannocystis exedens]SFF44688.1 hypothetical protein SAMN02745121_08915 [Nannocystis exedens]
MSLWTTLGIPAAEKTSAQRGSVTVVRSGPAKISVANTPSSTLARIAGNPNVNRSAPTAARSRSSGSNVLNMNTPPPLQSPSPRPGAPELPEFGLLEGGRASQDFPENT